MGARALVLPGRAYTPPMSLLDLSWRALEEHGYEVDDVEWRDDEPEDPADMTAWVRTHVEAAPVPDVAVAKSRGTHAAGWAADHGVPAVWLTPLLVLDHVVSALRANPAPQLLVGGLADDLWDAEAAAGLMTQGCRVLEIPGADHALADPSSAVRTAEIHLDVVRAVDAFLGSLA